MIGFWRLFGASLFLLVFSATQYKKINWREAFQKPNIFYISASGFFFFIHLWTYKFAAQNTTIANSMILFAVNPLFTAMITTKLMKERFERRYILSYILAFTSIYLLISEKIDLSSQNFLGNLSALCSALLYSMYIISGKKARHTTSNLTYTLFIYSIAAFCFFSFSLYKGTELLNYPIKTWSSILLLILFPTFLGHVIFSYLLKILNINWMSTGKLIEPVLSTIVAYFVFQEPLSQNTAFSFTLTALALIILFSGNKSPGL